MDTWGVMALVKCIKSKAPLTPEMSFALMEGKRLRRPACYRLRKEILAYMKECLSTNEPASVRELEQAFGVPRMTIWRAMNKQKTRYGFKTSNSVK